MKRLKKEQVIIKYKESRDKVLKAYIEIGINKIKIGEYFYKLKKEVGHGNFIKVLETEYNFMTPRSVQRYISTYKNNLKIEES